MVIESVCIAKYIQVHSAPPTVFDLPLTTATVSDEYLKEPRVCSWKLRGSWVDVFHDRLEEQDCSDDHTVVLIRLIRDKHS